MGFMNQFMNNKLNVCVLTHRGSDCTLYRTLLEYKKSLYSLSEFILKYGANLDGNWGINKNSSKDSFTKLLYEYFLEFNVSYIHPDKLSDNYISSKDIDILLVDVEDVNEGRAREIEKLFNQENYDNLFVILYGDNVEKHISQAHRVLTENMEYIYGKIEISSEDRLFSDFFFCVKSIISILKLNRICTGLRKISNTDELTGLYNMRAYWRLYSQTLIKYKREESSFGILMIDVDNFKTINDTYYHMVGSRTLYEIGGILKNYIRKDNSCYISRYGGDEYISVVETNSEDDFYNFVNELKLKLSNHRYLKGFYDIKLTVSIGAVYVNQYNAFLGEEPIKLADLLLYKSKIMGKDRVSSYSINNQSETEQVIKNVADEIIKKSNNTVKIESLRSVALDNDANTNISSSNKGQTSKVNKIRKITGKQKLKQNDGVKLTTKKRKKVYKDVG